MTLSEYGGDDRASEYDTAQLLPLPTFHLRRRTHLSLGARIEKQMRKLRVISSISNQRAGYAIGAIPLVPLRW